MLERKRQGKYNPLSGDAGEDVELGEGTGGQETGVTREGQTLEEEVDNWDENAEDWEEDADGNPQKANGSGEDIADSKRRAD